MNRVDRDPARLSSLLSGSAAVVAFGVSAFYSWPALVVGAVGLVLVVVGLVRGLYNAVTLGAFGLFVGAILAGMQTAAVSPVLISVTAAVLAWDIGTNAISIGSQLGRDANTRRIEVVHVVASTGVGVVTSSVGYGLYVTGIGNQPITALFFLLIAAVLLLESLR
ncbi:hypothetical protein ACFQH2_17635 [Natronoarchaeum sp. GCM10025703]|uniref:DUF7519 family protein n=1 Tax=unclassified Natronoarchaeum TaxID=2620183 RepID=UPI00361CAD41